MILLKHSLCGPETLEIGNVVLMFVEFDSYGCNGIDFLVSLVDEMI